MHIQHVTVSDHFDDQYETCTLPHTIATEYLWNMGDEQRFLLTITKVTRIVMYLVKGQILIFQKCSAICQNPGY